MSGDLPKGWVETQLNDLVRLCSQKISPASAPDSIYIGLEDVEPHSSRIIKYSKAINYKSSSACFAKGDILYNRLRPYLNKVLIAPQSGIASAEFLILRTEIGVSQRFVLRWIMSGEFLNFTAGLDKGDRPRVDYEQIGTFPIKLPPTAEQQRIVAKIDALFARSSRAREALAAIPALIDRYRQAVLAAAFRGDLTADWRASNSMQDADRHLDNVLQERRTRWQAKQSASRRKAYPQPEQAENFPEIDLPEGWTWASVDQLTTEMQYGTSSKTNEDASGIPVLRMGNIFRGELQVENLKYLPADHNEFPTLLLDEGDILFNRTNSPELVGKAAVFKGQLPRASFASYLIRLKTIGVLPRLLSAYINSPYGRSWIASVVSQQVGQANVNGTKLSRLAVPLMPYEEQVVLDRRISATLTSIDAMEREMFRASALIDRLDQSILDKAFSGRLVPQDPADEPAAQLLERIRAARASAPNPKRGRRARG